MQERHDPYISLRNPSFLWNVASLVALTLGTQIQATVVALQVYALTKDPLSLGLVGLAEALTQPELLGAQLLDLFSVLFGGAPALLPIFASEILGAGPQGLGVLRAAPAAGAVLVSVFLIHRKIRKAGPTLFLCVGAFGCAGYCLPSPARSGSRSDSSSSVESWTT